MTLPRPRFGLFLAALLATGFGVSPLAGQLRPLDPVDWHAFDPGVVALAGFGGDAFTGQRASAAGMRGRVLEAPAALVSWTTGRVVLRAIVHPWRHFWGDTAFAAPLAGTDPAVPGRRDDAGDNAVETIVRLTPLAVPTSPLLALRYGVRISTHNDRKGLDRHKTDFYALLGGRTFAGRWTLTGEGGLGVYGARQVVAENALPFLYALGVHRRVRAWEPALELVGQAARHPPRGNENLSELRVGVRRGDERWVQVSAVKGLTDFSPRLGVIVFGGFELPRRRAR